MLFRILVIFALMIPAARAEPVILVYGDSLSAAYGLPQEVGWVSLLQERLTQKNLNYRVVNASISGETTQGGLYRINSTLATHKPAIVILELGGNDGLRGLPLITTRANLDGIIQACRKQNAKVLLLGMRLPPNYGTAYEEKFQEIYRELARRHKLAPAPFMLEGIAGRRELFQADGIHPIAEAQPLIMDNVWKYLVPMLKGL